MHMRWLSILLILIAPLVSAATRDFPIAWEQDLLDINGDPIEKVDGFRVFTADGVFVQLLPGTARDAVLRVNVPWGETCFKMRSFYAVSGVEYESADSNIGACRTIQPGRPVPPKVTN